MRRDALLARESHKSASAKVTDNMLVMVGGDAKVGSLVSSRTVVTCLVRKERTTES